MEVSPNVLQRWRKEFREGPRATAFSGNETLGGLRPVAELERKSVSKLWRSIFEGVLAAHRRTTDAAGDDWEIRSLPEVKKK